MQTLINDLYGVLDSEGRVKDFAVDGTEMGVVTGTTDPITGGVVSIVVSSTAPSDADGRPDGTIYVQTV